MQRNDDFCLARRCWNQLKAKQNQIKIQCTFYMLRKTQNFSQNLPARLPKCSQIGWVEVRKSDYVAFSPFSLRLEWSQAHFFLPQKTLLALKWPKMDLTRASKVIKIKKIPNSLKSWAHPLRFRAADRFRSSYRSQTYCGVPENTLLMVRGSEKAKK